jgi:hypothetical protein
VLRTLPAEGPLFPYLRTVRAGDRATEFKQRCDGLKIKDNMGWSGWEKFGNLTTDDKTNLRTKK